MDVRAFSRHREAVYYEVTLPRHLQYAEEQLTALAQAEAEELADSPLPPDPGEWFNWIEVT